MAFNGTMVEEPIIASLAMDLQVRASILGADTRNVDGKAFGTMLITLPEEPELKQKVLDYLNDHAGITAEEVKRHD